ncbi:MAG TPA: trigger factor [Candidatus Polarisedimenticolia bacterium]|nr:trigger factor [Candidatus Polarisedimenticolia bacterium]
MPANDNDAMTVVVNELERCKRGLEVAIPHVRVADEMDRAFREYAHHARVPGFRKGHIPMDVVRRRFGKEVRDEVIGRIVRTEALRILEERRLDPVEPPVLEEVTYEDGQPLKFRATFEVRPAIEVSDYRGLSVTVPKHAVTDEMVESSVRGLAERAARLEAISGRPVQKGDFIVGTLSCRFVKGKGKNLKDEPLLLEAGSEENHPDFNAAILGMEAGTTRTFEVDYPADYNAVSLRNSIVEYTLVLQEIKKKVVPPLDDSLAKEIGAFASMEEMRARVRSEIERRAALAERDEARQRLLADLVRRHPMEVPDAMVEAQIDARVEALAREMIARGVDPMKAEIDWPQERERARPGATDAVRAMLLLDAIAAREKIEASEDDLNEVLKEEARRHNSSVASVKEKLGQSARLAGIRRQIVREKSLDFVLRDATITPEVR